VPHPNPEDEIEEELERRDFDLGLAGLIVHAIDPRTHADQRYGVRRLTFRRNGGGVSGECGMVRGMKWSGPGVGDEAGEVCRMSPDDCWCLE
jgi:hypothetical protein